MKNKIIQTGILIFPLFFLLVGVVKVKAEPYGWSPNVDNSWQGPPTCTDAKPDKAPILLQPNHPALPQKPKNGEVVLYWHRVPGATGYNIYYGLTPKNYIFSAPDIGDTNNFTVRFLPNKLFYFVVQAKKGCAASGLSKEWAARPGGTGFASTIVLGTFPGTPIKRKTPSSVGQTNGVTVVVPTVSQSNKNAQVKGVQAEPTEPTYQAPAYKPQVAVANVPTPTPKPKGFFAKVLSFFGFGN